MIDWPSGPSTIHSAGTVEAQDRTAPPAVLDASQRILTSCVGRTSFAVAVNRGAGGRR